ncbi:MAG: hypothetical protein ACI9RG_001127 [Sulfurimonas sp.]|jgi:hypothetical protein
MFEVNHDKRKLICARLEIEEDNSKKEMFKQLQK